MALHTRTLTIDVFNLMGSPKQGVDVTVELADSDSLAVTDDGEIINNTIDLESNASGDITVELLPSSLYRIGGIYRIKVGSTAAFDFNMPDNNTTLRALLLADVSPQSASPPGQLGWLAQADRPTNPVLGLGHYDIDDNTLAIWDGSDWSAIAGGGGGGGLSTVHTSAPVSGSGSSSNPVTIGTGEITQTFLAENSVGRTQLRDNSVGSDQIANNAVTNAEIADGVVGESKLGANSVSSEKLRPDSVTTAELGNDAVTNANILDNTIAEAKLNAEARAKLNATSSGGGLTSVATSAPVSGTGISGSPVTIAADAIQTTHIADDAVTSAKLSASVRSQLGSGGGSSSGGSTPDWDYSEGASTGHHDISFAATASINDGFNFEVDRVALTWSATDNDLNIANLSDAVGAFSIPAGVYIVTYEGKIENRTTGADFNNGRVSGQLRITTAPVDPQDVMEGDTLALSSIEYVRFGLPGTNTVGLHGYPKGTDLLVFSADSRIRLETITTCAVTTNAAIARWTDLRIRFWKVEVGSDGGSGGGGVTAPDWSSGVGRGATINRTLVGSSNAYNEESDGVALTWSNTNHRLDITNGGLNSFSMQAGTYVVSYSGLVENRSTGTSYGNGRVSGQLRLGLTDLDGNEITQGEGISYSGIEYVRYGIPTGNSEGLTARPSRTDVLVFTAPTQVKLFARSISNILSTPVSVRWTDIEVKVWKIAIGGGGGGGLSTVSTSDPVSGDGSSGSPVTIADGAIVRDQIAANAIGSAQIAGNAVTRAKIANDAVNGSKIANNSVTISEIAANAVGTAELVPASVNASKIAPGAVNNDKLADNAVNAAKIAANSVVASKLATSAVVNDKLGPDAVTEAKIADDAVRSEHIRDSEIAAAHLDTDTDTKKTAFRTAIGVTTSGSAVTHPVWPRDEFIRGTHASEPQSVSMAAPAGQQYAVDTQPQPLALREGTTNEIGAVIGDDNREFTLTEGTYIVEAEVDIENRSTAANSNQGRIFARIELEDKTNNRTVLRGTDLYLRWGYLTAFPNAGHRGVSELAGILRVDGNVTFNLDVRAVNASNTASVVRYVHGVELRIYKVVSGGGSGGAAGVEAWALTANPDELIPSDKLDLHSLFPSYSETSAQLSWARGGTPSHQELTWTLTGEMLDVREKGGTLLIHAETAIERTLNASGTDNINLRINGTSQIASKFVTIDSDDLTYVTTSAEFVPDDGQGNTITIRVDSSTSDAEYLSTLTLRVLGLRHENWVQTPSDIRDSLGVLSGNERLPYSSLYIPDGSIAVNKLAESALDRMSPANPTAGQYLRVASDGSIEAATPTVAITRTVAFNVATWEPSAGHVWTMIGWKVPQSGYFYLELGKGDSDGFAVTPLIPAAQIYGFDGVTVGSSLVLATDDFVRFTLAANSFANISNTTQFAISQNDDHDLVATHNRSITGTTDVATPLRVITLGVSIT